MSDDLRIKDDDPQSRVDLIRQMQQQQEQQAQLDPQDRAERVELDHATTAQRVGPVEQVSDLQEHEQVDAVNADTKIAEERPDVRGQANAQELARADHADHVDGAERTTEAVDAAHQQQGRGETWHEFRDASATDVPPSVEETAREQRQREDARQQEKDQISARELQNQMAVNNRMIKS